MSEDIVLLSDPDKRDFKAEWIYKNDPLPDSHSVKDSMLRVRKQMMSSCVAQALVGIKEYQEYLDNDIHEPLSVMDLYMSRADTNTRGMSIREGLELLRTRGVCTLRSHKKKKYGRMTKERENYKAAGYARIRSIEGMKKAILYNGPVIIGTRRYQPGAGYWKKAEGHVGSYSFHAAVLVGYDKKNFELRNSAGDKWENDGYCNFPINDFNKIIEAWTIIDKESVDYWYTIKTKLAYRFLEGVGYFKEKI
jgi:hypothetical protein